MSYRLYIFSVLALFLLFNCKDNNDKVNEEVANINVDLNVERFDIAFTDTPASQFSQLKDAYPFMFASQYDDSFWLERKADTLDIEIAKETREKFKDFKTETNEIKLMYQHLKFYFPTTKIPRIITFNDRVVHQNRVFVTDTITLIELDTYLGKDHKFYQGMQKYLAQQMEPEYIVSDLADAYAKRYILDTNRKTLLDEMIYHGKILYFKDKIIPFKSNAQKIKYTPQQLEWVQSNEDYIWRYFVEKELLFSTDAKLPNRFINPAPFSKFYLEQIDNDSPGRVGRYIGWQIVKSYAEKNDVSLVELLNTPAQTIFNNAKYKPNK